MTPLIKSLAGQAAAVAALGALFACSTPPFNKYDPPPTFAFRYTADPRIGGEATYSGSNLQFFYRVDIMGTMFEPRGNRNSYQRNVTFYTWYVVDDARWPARWDISSVGGACLGRSIQLAIDEKIFEFQCTVPERNVSVLPGTYENDSPPQSLTVQFDGSVAGGTQVAIWIVNESAGTLISGPTHLVVDSGGAAAVPAPAVPEGHYTVVVEFSDQSNPATGGFNVVDECRIQDVWVDDYCTGTHEVCQDVTITVDDWCPATRPVCDTRTDWVSDYCESSAYVCDTGSQWVDDYCESSNWVCDYQTFCEGSCDEWGCWESCWDEAYNCREETYSYVCGGHEESFQYNCRWETSTYVCGGHWEDTYFNCREESYSYLCGSHEETHQDCRDQQYEYVCGGHWETRRTCSS